MSNVYAGPPRNHTQYLVANTEALSEDRITDFTLTVFNDDTDRGQNRYSMLVNQ